jgi:ArsR family transcriptional regulator
MPICTDTQILLQESNMENEAAFFKVLSDPTRLRLAVLLSIQGETCVCQLAEALNAPEYKISRHLGIMRSAGAVKARREGTWMYYKLSKARNRLEECLQECFRDCLADNKTVKTDLKRLSTATCKAV